MPAFSIEKTNRQDVYEKFNFPQPAFREGEFLQSWQWSNFIEKINGKTIKILVKDSNKKTVGKALLVIKKMGPLFSYAYCPCGPILDYQNLEKSDLALIFKALEEFCKKLNCFFFRFNPPLPKNFSNLPVEENSLVLSQAKTKQPEKTLYLPLKNSPEKILELMKAKTRYNIRLAGRKKLSVKKENSLENLNAFLKLVKETKERNNFDIYPTAYYQTLAKIFRENGFLKIYTAFYKKNPLASIMVITHKNTATYLHGSSSNNFRNLMAPYLVQWEAILEAKSQNLDYYDFWGIDEKKWPGVTRFKMGFGGEVAEFQPTYEIAVQKRKYFFYNKIRLMTGR